MYHVIKASPNSSHGLNEYLSRRGESTLEAFHLALAHFGNTGMRDSLADNLNLTGTARYNLAIWYKLRLATKAQEDRVKIPAAWEAVVPFFNHSELAYLNDLAKQAGLDIGQFPFKDVETLLQQDTGERFFSKYLTWLSKEKPRIDPTSDMCLCSRCGIKDAPLSPEKELDVTTVNGEDASQVSVATTPNEPVNAPTTPNPVPPPFNHGLVPILPMPMPMPIFNPFLWMPPPPSCPSFCCEKFRQYSYCTGKKGQPPHDCHCITKQGTFTI